MSRICVTGSAGFIGTNLVRQLLEDDHDVVGVDNLSSGTIKNATDVDDYFCGKKNVSYKFIQGDLCDKDICREAVEGTDFVLHQAALGSVPRSVEQPERYLYNNVTSTVNILLTAKDAGVKRFVYASSASVYGDVPGGYLREDMASNPYNPYAVSKLAAEWVVRVFWRSYGFPTVSLRYFNVFGPRQRPDGPYAAVVPAFIEAALEHKPAELHGGGQQARDFTYVDNVVQANLLACKAPETANGETFNIAAGGFTTIQQLHRMVAEATGDNTPYRTTEARAGDVHGCRSDIDKARTVLAYNPAINVAEGIDSTVEWYSQNRKGV